jgi:hypothetical protein
MSMSAATEQIMFNEMTRVRKSGKHSPHESNYTRLFGTPERAARTISVTAKCFEPATACRECIYKGYCDTECDYGKLLEWLRGDAE